jgi:hypothetical protein
MAWTERNSDSRQNREVAGQVAENYDQVRETLMPVAEAEAEGGQKPFEPVSFHPVDGPGIFDAEVGMKSGTVIIHLWPEGGRLGNARQKIKPLWKTYLQTALGTRFRPGQGSITYVPEVDSLCVELRGLSEDLYWKEACYEALSAFYQLLGGQPGINRE